MNNPNQNPQNNPMKMGLDPSKMQLPSNPQNLASLTAGQLLPLMASLTSAFGGGVGSESYNHFLPGEVTQSELIKKLREKFAEVKEDVEKMDKNPEKFKTHQLPLARIKKIMKSDEDVRMISAEAPVLFAKVCELFIIELTHRSWIHTEEGKRRTLQKNDVAQCLVNTDIFDFLIDIIPREEYAKTTMMIKKNAMAGAFPSSGMGGGPAPGMGGLSFPMQMMGGPNMMPPGQMNLNQNKSSAQSNMMFPPNMGMMGGNMGEHAGS